MPTLHKNKKGNLAEETGTGQEGRGETETDMSGHEENTKKTKDTVSEPKFYKPQAATGHGHRPNGHRPEVTDLTFCEGCFCSIYTLFVFNQKQHHALNSNPLIFLTEHLPFVFF
jgi:hypothetical protein